MLLGMYLLKHLEECSVGIYDVLVTDGAIPVFLILVGMTCQLVRPVH